MISDLSDFKQEAISYLPPIAFVDLDDTLFQTRRKMTEECGWAPAYEAALDRSLAPRSFMTERQRHFCAWLLQSCELIPVTARGTEEIKRVQIPFKSWQITTHGAVILAPDGQPLSSWQHKIKQCYQNLKTQIVDLHAACNTLIDSESRDAWARINYEYDHMPIYFVMKHRNSQKVDEIYQIADLLRKNSLCDDFYVHKNGNNVAFIPNFLNKGLAVQHLLLEMGETASSRPIIGFGDSLSDYHFLQHCDWFGMPQMSQFSPFLKPLIDP